MNISNNRRPFPGRGRRQGDKTLINERIHFPEVRLIAADGEQHGVVSTRIALQQAQEAGLDLVVIGNQNPPVAKIMDYGKYKFEQSKQEKENKKKNKQQSVLKEVQLRPRIDSNDLATKEKKIWEWLQGGFKVRVIVQLRGREMQHKDLGRELLKEVLGRATEYGKSDRKPDIKMEGRNITLQLAPHSK